MALPKLGKYISSKDGYLLLLYKQERLVKFRDALLFRLRLRVNFL